MDRLRSMEVFVTVIERGGFAPAAGALGISAVMVGKHVRQLEERLGTRLLERTTRKQRPTPAGAGFYDDCRKVLEQVRMAEAGVESLQSAPRGLLRVSAPVTFGQTVIAPLLAGYLAAYPQVQVELMLSNRRVDLIEDGFDLAIRIGPLGEANLVARPLRQYCFALCAAPEYLARHGTPQHPSELMQHHWLTHFLQGERNERTGFIDGHGRSWPVQSRYASNDSHALRQAALAGHGILRQPRVLLEDDLAAGRLQAILADYVPAPLPVHLVYLPDPRPRPKLHSLVDFLQQALG